MMRGLGASFGVALVSVILAAYLGAVPSHTVDPRRVVDAIRIAIAIMIVAAAGAGWLSLRRRTE